MPANPNTAEPGKPHRRWYQFSREGLLVIVVVLAVCVGIFYRVTRPTRDDEERAKVIEKLKVLGDALNKYHDAMEKRDKDSQKVFEKAPEK